jgi:tRNA A-37 threonylcarbamoyl transferase component Bud32
MNFFNLQRISMDRILVKEVQERFPDYIIRSLGNNVVRLSTEDRSYIAKSIWHDTSDPDGDMGINARDKAYRMELKVIRMLPSWWGLRLVDTFKTPLNRVIIMNEIDHMSWSSYRGNDVEFAKRLQKQVKWLHSHKITHNDLELKNILLTEDGPLLIDFEKSSVATKEKMKNDYRVMIAAFKENENTKSIANILQRYIEPRRTKRKTI